MNNLIDRAEAQTAIQSVARRYTVAHEAHGEGKVVWSDDLISVTDAMNVLREISSAQPELDSEALIRTIEMGITATNSNDIYSLGMRNGMRWCKSLIDGVEPKFEDYVTSVDDWKKLPSAQPEQRWIPCSERLPEEEIDVLVTRKFLGCKDSGHGWNNHMPPKTYVEVAQYFCGEWEALSDEYKIARNRHTNPIAWMPLPEPYKEEGI